LCNLAYVAHRRGDNDAALGFFHEAVAAYRDLDDLWHLAGLLMEQAAQQARMRRYTEALKAVAESSRLDEQIGRLPERSYRLAVAAVVHLACGQPAKAITALGAFDAHRPRSTGVWRPGVGVGGGHIPWLDDAVDTARSQLDLAEVAAATAAARRKSLDELIDDLIIQPAEAAVHRGSHGSTGDG
jgi:tetratricopeptide (TPR) repeat protein